MLIVLFLSMFALFIFGVPIAISIGLASVIALLWDGSIPLLVVGQRLITSIDMFTLMAIPTFILAGTLMEFGGISKRLVNFANALTGHITGGLGLVAVVAAMFLRRSPGRARLP